jgi:hypothetical protein
MSDVTDPAPPTISLPNANETLGMQFSVFGTCDPAVTTVAVKLYNGPTEVALVNAVVNGPKGTYEAFFNLNPSNPLLQNNQGQVKADITYNGKDTGVSVAGLTICDELNGLPAQTTLTITNPQPGQVLANWATGAMASGQIANAAGLTFWVRITDAGFDVIPHKSWVITPGSTWQQDLGALLASVPHIRSTTFNLHASVWPGGGPVALVRVSSGFFTFQG